MINIIYDPKAYAHPDGEIMDTAQRFVADAQRFRGINIITGSETLILAFRVLIKEKVIDASQVIVQYKEHTITFAEDGGCTNWPDGFCDTALKLLNRLIL